MSTKRPPRKIIASSEALGLKQRALEKMAMDLHEHLFAVGFNPMVPLDDLQYSIGDRVVLVEAFQGELDETFEMADLFGLGEVDQEYVLRVARDKWVIERAEGRTLEEVARGLYKIGRPMMATDTGTVVVFQMGEGGRKGKRVLGVRELCGMATGEISKMMGEWAKDWEGRDHY